MAIAAKYLPHYTYSDYEQWEGRWELIFGIPYAMTPSPLYRHQVLAARLIQLFMNKLNDCQQCQVVGQLDWKISDDTVVCPDIAIVCDAIDKFIEQSPILVVEILSPSTRQKDKMLKFEIYQEQGVKYYLLVDPENNTMEICILKNGKYIKQDADQQFDFVLDDCKVAADFSDLFK